MGSPAVNTRPASNPTSGSWPAATDARCVDDDADPQAQRLWDALARARAEYAPRLLAEAEDAVFRFYLPLAKSLAGASTTGAQDTVAVEQAAELGLAQAVLAWPGADSRGFERFARAAITSQLSQIPHRATRSTSRAGATGVPRPLGAATAPSPGGTSVLSRS